MYFFFLKVRDRVTKIFKAEPDLGSHYGRFLSMLDNMGRLDLSLNLTQKS